MRTVNFRNDVLWAIAQLLGQDPTPPASDLDPEQAASLTSFINAWVRRLYDKLDWPEWTVIEPRAPDANHYVSFDQAAETPIGKVFKVYLRNPDATRGPLETPFRLSANGIHCGYEHGANVWIKFGLRAPQFTSTPWKSTVTFALGDLTFDPTTGNCYSSIQGNNTNHAVTDATWWAVIPFPYAICEPVVHGAYSDALREEGQTDKAAAEEQAVTALILERASSFTAADYGPLTDRQPPASQYRTAQTAIA
jgi:hypothetical protein